MDLKQYITEAIRTESQLEVINTDVNKLMNVMQLFAAAGNMLDALKKNIFYNKEINQQNWTSNLVAIEQIAKAGLTDSPTTATTLEIDPRLFHALIGFATESTELIEAIIKALLNDTDIDHVNVREEFFDLMWYLLIGHDALNQDMEGTLIMGFEKLRKRYPDKFTTNNAINRDPKTEREILESHHST